MAVATPSHAAPQDLVLRGIEKNFDRHSVLKGIDLTIPDGELVTLLGPSGCGKTTLLRIIAGFELPNQGSVHLGGRDLLPLSPHQRPVNTVFQNYALFSHLNVYDNIAFGLVSHRTPEKVIHHKVGAMLEMMRIQDLCSRKPATLSGGQRQRVALARALINEPEVLLLDEPLSALDAHLRKDLQAELKTLQRNTQITFVLVTHDQDEAIAVSDRILLMNQGVIEQEGTPEQVYEHPVSRFAAEFLGHANILNAQSLNDLEVSTPIGHLVVSTQPRWKKGTLAIRPEDILVLDEGDRQNSIPGTIQEYLYRGDHWELRVACHQQVIRVMTPPNQDHTIGKSVFLQLPQEHLQVLRD